MEEVWEDIFQFDGLYLISNKGRVMSKWFNKIRFLKSSKSSNGYLTVKLKRSKEVKSYSIHRLIALAFIDNPNNKCFVNHIDGNKLNNSIENLEWCTHQENNQHANNTGLMDSAKGENHCKAVLSEKDVINIRLLLESSENVKKIATLYRIHRNHVYNIKNRKI